MNKNSTSSPIIITATQCVVGVGKTFSLMKENEPFHFIGEIFYKKADILSETHSDPNKKSCVHFQEPLFKTHMYAAYVELQLIAEKFLILLNLSNTHWIVVTLSTQILSYFLGSEPISFSTTHCTRLGD